MRNRAPLGILIAALVALLATGCGPVPLPTFPPDPPAPVSLAHIPAAGPTTHAATDVLAQLVIAPPHLMRGYSRLAFGGAWADTDRNGCDQRNDVLRRDLVDTVTAPGSRCTIARGTLHDAYTGTTIAFERGPRSARVQVDHIVSLGDAWRSGADTWTPAQRLAFATDLRNLMAVDGPSNERKGDDPADRWVPPRPGAVCPYVAVQIEVKARYGLTITGPEHDAMARVLATCPGQQLPKEIP